MQQLRISQNDFNLKGFVESTYEFLTNSLEDVVPYACTEKVYEIGGTPTIGDSETGRDVFDDLNEEGTMVFFPFAIPDCDGGAYYASGGFISYAKEEGEIEEENVTVIPEGLLGETDVLGFLIRKDKDDYIIDSAISCAGACMAPLPSIELVEDAEEFEDEMKKFISLFLKAN